MGVRVVGIRRRTTHAAPYGYPGGIHWPTRTIVTNLPDPSPWEGCLLVHELSHVLVERDPNDVCEVTSAMLALDYAGCRLLKLAWSQWMEEYEVDSLSWCLMSRTSKTAALDLSRTRARNLGLLDARGRPTYQRIPP